MNHGETIKTTIRLPAELHWQFQTERAKRRLSNEKAISEAFAFWITHPRGQNLASSKSALSRRSQLPAAGPEERECVENLLNILRDRESAQASVIKAILHVLSSRPWESRGPGGPGGGKKK
jgi:predicted component of type VI protein secretion system